MRYAMVFLVYLLSGLYGTVYADPPEKASDKCVILLHGLVRSSASMDTLQDALQAHGYTVVNYAYPSRDIGIEKLASTHIPRAIDTCSATGASQIHFVTHSMGGILVRHYLRESKLVSLGRVVMLSPPNNGSELVDRMQAFPGFGLLNGPAGRQLGTDQASVPRALGAVDYPVGVITGNRSVNLFLSTLLPGADDGKVTVKSAKVEGMSDFLVVPYTHTMIMKRERVIQQTLRFLREGNFDHEASYLCCDV